MNLLAVPGLLWSLGRKVEELLALQGKIREALEIVDNRLHALEERMTYLEAKQDQIIVEARAAAGAASTMVAGAIISDAVTRLTRLEMRAEEAAEHLPPSQKKRLPSSR